MKTAISISDDIFARAETFAASRGMSRSELYATALDRYLAEHEAQHITERLDQVYAAHDSRLEPALARAQAAAVGCEEW